MQTIEKWDIFEVECPGRNEGNPFVDYSITGTFTSRNESVTVDGFYDGDGIYRVRFMPSFEGTYTYKVSGSFSEEVFEGEFLVTPAAEGNHGPMRVVDNYHFCYEDGTPYYSIGTTAYVWTHQSEEQQQETLETLKNSAFNKIRFCVFPKHYLYNYHEPITYPYEFGNQEGLDTTGLDTLRIMPPCEKYPAKDFNYFKFNVEHFKHLDLRIRQLRDMNIEADLIVMHPYDRWGFNHMTAEADDLYWKYVIARFAAYRNIWWSLSNEYDFIRNKTLADWERYAAIIVEKDPYKHLRSIHNGGTYYDYSRPWITHCSMQRIDFYRHVEYTDEYRTRYGKPVVWDEICYEGNIDQGWGNISGQELVRRFWEASMRGGYAGHGETFVGHNDVFWWSHGGKLYGDSPERFRFLHQILSETPGNGFLKIGRGSFDEVVGVPEKGADGQYEIHYLGLMRPTSRMFFKNPEDVYEVEVIDTWNMTIESKGYYSGLIRIEMPGREYMAVRLKKVTGVDPEKVIRTERPF